MQRMFQVVETGDMTIPQWERVKAQYAAAGYQYAAGLVVFRHMPPAGGPGPLSVVPPSQEGDRT
jgi:hypothetical protein